jgi:hypothetical protein
VGGAMDSPGSLGVGRHEESVRSVGLDPLGQSRLRQDAHAAPASDPVVVSGG